MMVDYGMSTRLDVSYEETVARVTDALKAEGFGVLTEIDVQATFKEKLDAGFRKYVIFGACNPNLAYRALNTEIEIGMLLPCNVIVYEEDGGSVVSIADPIAMLGVSENEELDSVAEEARARLKRALESL